MTVRVFVVDDQELVRTGCVMVVDSQPDMVVVGEAGDGAEALERLAVTGTDVVLMDVRMPRMDGIEATSRLMARPDPPRVIALTTFDLDEYAFAAIRAGAAGFLLKDAPAADTLAAIRTVHRGDAVIAPSTTRRLIEHIGPDLGPPDPGVDPAARLTPRERDVLLEMARGAGNAEIARRMFVSEGTVKTHVARVLAKLGLRDRIQVVIWAYENRLIRPGRPSSSRPGVDRGR
ncbi:LuxR family two component transcriptional regulator [Stackebrandtia albiflava]|uniref:LuxR family two component transcriptional regulator n=1 Tax=Stackebrandtia albiflava TaxID=406432 RepID=A0A562UYJ5_9ACTN|nr:response regulator transcription factor [Stackebrandtia albiflava]TWJ10689.1 LuxR family two component transcriptional regulator [Stackebrandtia albiflava]